MIINILKNDRVYVENILINHNIFYEIFQKYYGRWIKKDDESVEAHIVELAQIDSVQQFSKLLQTSFI